jgi:hypothetical protein
LCRFANEGELHPSDEPIAARFAYFQALRKYWPEVLETLRSDVFPKYVPKSQEMAGSYWRASDLWKVVQSDDSRNDLAIALFQWAKPFHITEDWIFQCALETLFVYHPAIDPTPIIRPRGKDWYWIYAPKAGADFFRPKLTHNIWSPSTHADAESWETFKRRMESQFKAQLRAYRRKEETRFGAGKAAKLAHDAEWTVRYQKGELAYEIAAGLTGPYKDREQTVYRTIERFAQAVGLNLRKTKKRRIKK